MGACIERAERDLTACRRGEALAVAVILAGDEATLDGLASRAVIGRDRARDGQAVGDDLRLGPYEGIVVALEGAA